LKEPEKAMEYYNRSLSIEPNHFQTLMNVGIAYMSMGDQDAAARTWQKVVDLYPDKPETAMIKDAVAKIRAEKAASGGNSK
jgi:regulator of sirC expression with transglutaminase-like and TPR domain